MKILTITRAIAILRQHANLSQRELALRVGSATETISRWETGRSKPTRQSLARLADIADSAGLNDLKDFIERQRAASIVANMKSLTSAGSQRRVALDDLQRWSATAMLMQTKIKGARESYIALISSCPPEHQERFDEGINRILIALETMAEELTKAIGQYINIPIKEKTHRRTTL